MWLARRRWTAVAPALIGAMLIALVLYGRLGLWGAEDTTGEVALARATEGAVLPATIPADVNPAVVRQPDLRPEPPRYLEDTSDPCASTWVVGLVLYISNLGTANAGPFEFTVNSTPYAVPAGLMKGQVYQMQVRQWPWSWLPGGSYEIIVDSQNQIVESSESNNRLTGLVPMVTARVSCTPSIAATPSPSATAGPSATPTLTTPPSPTALPSNTATRTLTPSPTLTATAGPSPTPTMTGSPTATATETSIPNVTASPLPPTTTEPSPTSAVTLVAPTKQVVRLPILWRSAMR